MCPYARPTPNVLHLVHRALHETLPAEAREYFESCYRHQLHDGNEETILSVIAEYGASPSGWRGRQPSFI